MLHRNPNVTASVALGQVAIESFMKRPINTRLAQGVLTTTPPQAPNALRDALERHAQQDVSEGDQEVAHDTSMSASQDIHDVVFLPSSDCETITILT